jgi:ERCC4-type nuclease
MSMSVTLKVDHREGKWKECYDALPECKEYNVVYENLEFGDFQYIVEEQVKLMIERKSIDDLLASIKDGRYKNQKARVLAQFQPQQVYYIIEGKRSAYHSSPTSIKDKIVQSAIVNTMLRDKISVFFTSSVQETFQLLLSIYKRIADDPTNYFVSSATEQTVVLSSAKDEPSKVWHCMLCQIPGISDKTATAIVTKWPSFQVMNQELQPLTTSAREEALSELKQNNRKLGKRTVDGILKQFY